MSSLTQRLTTKKIATPPKWLPTNIQYETMMGSMAYGTASDSSDLDIYGFVIPPKEDVFPHLRGEVIGFGTHKSRFEQYQQHHMLDPSARAGKGQECDITIFSIVKYFNLCMQCNPNMIDSLFTPRTAVTHITSIGEMVRESRKLFLSKAAWPRFKGYAYSQLHKMSIKNPDEGSERWRIVQKYGFDVKFAYHVCRLLMEVEQILIEHDLELDRKSSREHLKAIRRGEVSEEEIRRWAADKEAKLENAYAESKLPAKPPEDKIKLLLLDCLEQHYGSLTDAIVQIDPAIKAIGEIREIIDGI